MPKTGTSSIQTTLNRNYSTLLKHGFFYRYAHFLYDIGSGGSSETAIEIPAACQTAIFSDEKLFKGIKSARGAQLIWDALRKVSDDITLVSYIRRQDEVFVSSYYTSLLAGSAEPFEDRPPVAFEMYDRLRLWESVVGRERMVIRKFGPDYLPDGVVADFLDIVGVAHVELAAPPPTNASPRTDALEVIRRINEAEPNADRLALKVIAGAIGTGAPLGLSADKRHRIADLSAEANDMLSRRYFDGGPLFTHAFPDDGSEPVALEAAQIAIMGNRIGAEFDMDAGVCPSDVDAAVRWLYALARKAAEHIREQASARERKLLKRRAV
jgi:hypothetical protein